MKFVQTTSMELVNLDFVARIVPLEREPNKAALRAADDTLLGLIYCKDMARLTSVLLPANGVVAVIISDYEEDGIVARESRVIGWRVHNDGGVEAVFVEEPLSDDLVLIKQPDGVLLVPDGRSYQNIDEAIEIFREGRKAEKAQ